MSEGKDALTPLPPGSTIGILGGGQLARMMAVAAAQLGLHTHIFSDVSGPAFDVAPRATSGDYNDQDALATFAAAVDVVTYEFENVPVAAADFLQLKVPVRPGSKALTIAQDRLREKTFIADLGITVAPFAAVDCTDDLAQAMRAFNAPAILKTRRLGYDGKGQQTVAPKGDHRAAVSALKEAPAILEKRLEFEAELSVLVVRGQDGATCFYDCPRNYHSAGILHHSTVPAGLPSSVIEEARTIAATITEALDYVGVLAVELFYLGEPSVLAAGKSAVSLVVNEIAPRVHNSGHWTLDACAISQFENHIRAVAGWPLGSADRHSDAIMHNLIGHEADDWRELASQDGACVHLYGKRQARDGRKMGHITRLSQLRPKS